MSPGSRAAAGFGSGDELLVLTAPDRSALAEQARGTAARLGDAEARSLRVLVGELGDAAPAGPLALAIVSDSPASLADKLRHAAERVADPDCSRINDRSGIFFTAEPLRAAGGRVAVLFPGEGSQYPGMLADLCLRFPEARRPFDRIDRVFEGRGREVLPSQIVFDRGERDRIWEMDCAVEVVFSANAALHGVLESLGVRADVMVGHSTGDYSALVASGAIAAADEAGLAALMLGLNDLHQRLAAARVVKEAGLLAVGAGDADEVDDALRELPALVLAMDNCPHQRVYAGPADAVAAARERLSACGAVLEELAFGRPYHTPAFWPALAMLRPFFEELPLRPPSVELWSCATASEVPGDAEELRDLVLRQWAMPVRFRETVENLWRAGVRLFIDAGPRGNLAAFVKDTLRGRPHLAVACDGVHRPTVRHLLFALGQLAAHGVPLDLSRLAVPAIPPPPTRVDKSAGGAAPRRKGPVLTLATGWPELSLSPEVVERYAAPRPAPAQVAAGPAETGVMPTRVGPMPKGVGDPRPPGPAGDELGELMTSHFEITRRIVEAQERVLTSFLAGAGSAAVAAPPAPSPLLGGGHVRQGDTVTAEVQLSLDRHRFLADHTLGRRVSTSDVGLAALAVLPLTMTLELAAEAALALVPGWVCTGFEDVVAQRWITLDGAGFADLHVAARRREDSASGAVVEVRIDGNGGGPCLHARVRVAPSYPPAPPARAVAVSGQPLWDRSRVYREAMFHGPSFQGIEEVGRIDEAGAEARLEVLRRDRLLRGGEPRFAIDPVLLDQPGQLVGVWTASRLSERHVIFPTRLGRLELFSPPPPPGLKLGCRAEIRLVGDNGIRSDLEVDDGAGLLHARFDSWEDRRFDVPDHFLRFMLDPVHTPLCPTPRLATGNDGSGGMSSARLARADLPPGFAADGGIWQRVVVGLTLARAEREVWESLEAPQERSERWLLARLAAKEAVRQLLARGGLELAPADIVVTDSGDRLVARGDWTAVSGGEVEVSIRYEDGVPAAEALCSPRSSDDPAGAGSTAHDHSGTALEESG